MYIRNLLIAVYPLRKWLDQLSFMPVKIKVLSPWMVIVRRYEEGLKYVPLKELSRPQHQMHTLIIEDKLYCNNGRRSDCQACVRSQYQQAY